MISTTLNRRDFRWQSRPDLHVLSYHDGDTGLPQPHTALIQVPGALVLYSCLRCCLF
jgi:hypothetical protein